MSCTLFAWDVMIENYGFPTRKLLFFSPSSGSYYINNAPSTLAHHRTLKASSVFPLSKQFTNVHQNDPTFW